MSSVERLARASRASVAVLVVAAVVLTFSPAMVFSALPHETTRVSVPNTPGQGNEFSSSPSVARGGELIAFSSQASNLVAGDAFGHIDVFLRDMDAGTTERVSVSSDGTQADDQSGAPCISPDGSVVFFQSYATNLVSGDSNTSGDVFVRDLGLDATARVSLADDESEGNGNSYDPSCDEGGDLVAFTSDSTNLVASDGNAVPDIFVRDRVAGTTVRASLSTADVEGDKSSSEPSLSSDGAFVAFESLATNLVGGDTNGYKDVFVRDLVAGSTERVSVGALGAQASGTSGGPSISGDGDLVAFESSASNLVAGDTNGRQDIFVHDRNSGTTIRVSVASDGSQGSGHAEEAHMSVDGRYVAFRTDSKLAAGDNNSDYDIYVHDLATGKTERVSLSTLGGDPNGGSGGVFVSPGGRWTAFSSDASNLVDGDSNTFTDVFITPTGPREYVRVAGINRYLTAVEASKRAYPKDGETEYVVIATGRNWPDALGGSALAGVLDGPLLLTGPTALPTDVVTEIVRLGTTKAYILGGEGAVGAGVEIELASLLGASNVTRLAGADRYTTAKKVADEVIALQGISYDKIALVATGGNYPDALAGSPLAAANGWPILLAHPTRDTLYVPGSVDEVVVLGGTGAVSSQVESDLKGLLGSGAVVRKGGSDRYGTAALVAEYGVAQGASWDSVGVATGQNFPDALSGGAMIGSRGSVLLLTRTSTLSDPAESRLEDNADAVGTLHIIGGTGAVSQSVEESIKSTVGE